MLDSTNVGCLFSPLYIHCNKLLPRIKTTNIVILSDVLSTATDRSVYWLTQSFILVYY